MYVTRSSAVSLYERCQRRWRYAHDNPEPASTAQAIGTAVHAALEEWLRDGKPFPATKAGAIAKKGLPFLPPPSKDLRVEITDILDVKSGVQFRRTIDLFDPIEPRLYDHKTFSDPRWIPTPAALLAGVQSSSYAMWAMDYLGVDAINATWVYYPKLGGNAVPVDVLFTRENISERWQQTLDNISVMNDNLFIAPNDLPANTEACRDYGKQCPFWQQCQGAEKGAGTMGLGLLANIKKNVPVAEAAPSLLERQLVASKPLIEKLAEGLAVGVLPPDAPPDTYEALPVEEPKKTRAKKPVAEKLAEASARADALGPQVHQSLEAFAGNVTVTHTHYVQPAEGLELWIGSLADGQPHLKIDALAGPIADSVAENNGVNHFGLIDYAKGGPMLAVAFDAWLSSCPPNLPIFVDRVPSDIGKAVLPVLLRRATKVQRGV